MPAKQRMRVANEKAASKVTERGKVPTSLVSFLKVCVFTCKYRKCQQGKSLCLLEISNNGGDRHTKSI